MAAVTGGVLAAGMAAYTIANAEKQKRDAKRALNDYERQDLTNAFEDMPISTVGSDFMREQADQLSAGLTDAARQGGSRTISAAIPQIVAATNDINREGQVYLDDQVNKRNYAIADDNTRIRGMKENRENADLAGIGQQLETSRQDSFNGMRGAYAALSSIGANYQPRPYVEAINTPNPAGTVAVGPTAGTPVPYVEPITPPTYNPGTYLANINWGF